MSEKSIMEAKLNSMLSRKKHDIGAVVSHISQSGTMIDDYVVDVPDMRFGATKSEQVNGVYIQYPDHRGRMQTNTIHDNAYNQFGGKFGIPNGFLRNLAHGDEWQQNLAADLLREHAHNGGRNRMLLRTVGGQTRAALSDRYKRLNSLKIFLTFLQAAQQSNAVLVDAHNGETRAFMEIIHPEVIEFDTPLNGLNHVCFGARLRNSDFGHGALELSLYLLVLKCLNGQTGQSLLRAVHMGGEIPQNIEISDETVIKDTEAKASLVKDAMMSVYTPDNREKLIEAVKGASKVEIDVKKETEKLPKLGLSKAEVQEFERLMLNNSPEDGLVGAPTKWKLVNGLTAMARDSEPERKRELEKIAGEMLGI